MVLKEVTILRLYIYVCPLYEKSLFTIAYLQLFVKSKHCTGYPLIQVEIVSHMKKSLYALAGFPKFLRVDFLVPGVCGHSWTVSSVGAGAGGVGAGAGMSSAGAGMSSAISSLLTEKYIIRDRGSIWCCQVDKVR